MSKRPNRAIIVTAACVAGLLAGFLMTALLGHWRHQIAALATPQSLPSAAPVRSVAASPSTSAKPRATGATLGATTAPAQPATPRAWPQPVHHSVLATVFDASEDGGPDNGGISNAQSAWDSQFRQHASRDNKFGFALPYNDLDDQGRRKSSVARLPWYDASIRLPADRSWVKGRWIAVRSGSRIAYAQWVDAGPFGEDDINYIADPTGATRWSHQPGQADAQDLGAGLDLLTGTAQYLGIDGEAKVDWWFVPANQVPNGPWLHTGQLITDHLE